VEFRFKALQQQHDPDDLDATVNLANPKSWIALFVTLLLILAAIGWSLLGRLPQTAAGAGIITRIDGVVRIEAGYQSVVAADPPAAGDRVLAGAPLITVTDPDGGVHQLTSPVGGTVMTADYRPGVVVPAGTPLVTVERDPADGPPLSAMVLVAAASAAAVRPGMAVDLTVDSVPARSFGLLRGRVLDVSDYPVTKAGLEAMVYDQATVAGMLSHGPMLLVDVELVADPATVSGYTWSSPAGPPYPLTFQASVTADIHLGSRRPIDFVFGAG
jgi:hypothetical protein